MSALEAEVLEKMLKLDEPAQMRVMTVIMQHMQMHKSGNWLEAARALRAEMEAKYGKLDVSISSLIDEVREERLNDHVEGINDKGSINALKANLHEMKRGEEVNLEEFRRAMVALGMPNYTNEEEILQQIDQLTFEEDSFIVQLTALNHFDEEKYRAVMNTLNSYASLVRDTSAIDKRAVRLLVGLLTFVDYSTFKSYSHGERVRQAQDEIVQLADRLAWARMES
jgi:hypothetical protein